MAAAPPRTRDAALALAAPVYLAIGPEVVGSAVLTPAPELEAAPDDHAAQVDETATGVPVEATGVLVEVATLTELYE